MIEARGPFPPPFTSSIMGKNSVAGWKRLTSLSCKSKETCIE